MSEVGSGRDARGRATRLPAAMRAHAWKPGQSGNPSGLGGEYQRCLMLCRKNSHAAAEEIICLSMESEDERVRYMAATWIFERAWGRARDYDPQTEAESGPRFDPSLLTPEQLDQVEAAMRLMLAATRPPDSPTPASASEPGVEVEGEAVEVETDSGKRG